MKMENGAKVVTMATVDPEVSETEEEISSESQNDE